MRMLQKQKKGRKETRCIRSHHRIKQETGDIKNLLYNFLLVELCTREEEKHVGAVKSPVNKKEYIRWSWKCNMGGKKLSINAQMEAFSPLSLPLSHLHHSSTLSYESLSFLPSWWFFLWFWSRIKWTWRFYESKKKNKRNIKLCPWLQINGILPQIKDTQSLQIELRYPVQ